MINSPVPPQRAQLRPPSGRIPTSGGECGRKFEKVKGDTRKNRRIIGLFNTKLLIVEQFFYSVHSKNPPVIPFYAPISRFSTPARFLPLYFYSFFKLLKKKEKDGRKAGKTRQAATRQNDFYKNWQYASFPLQTCKTGVLILSQNTYDSITYIFVRLNTPVRQCFACVSNFLTRIAPWIA